MFFRKKKTKSKIIRPEFKGSLTNWKKKRNFPKNDSNFWSRLFFRIFFLAFFCVVFYIFLLSRFVIINSVFVEGAVNTDSEAIKSIAQGKMKGEVLKYFKKSNFIILSKKNIEKEVKEKYKIIDRMEIKKEFPDKLRIMISEKTPSLVISEGEKCFIADKEGFVFDEAGCQGEYLDIENLAILKNEKKKEIKIGDKYLELGYINFLTIVRNELEENLEIELEKEMFTPSIISSDIRLKTKEGWEIYLNEKLGYKKELEMLQTVMENKITAEQRKDLEYVDLRTENKVYYKFENSDVEKKEEQNDKSSEKERS